MWSAGRTLNKRQGFALLELIVVLLLLALMSAMALPGLSRTVESMRLRKEAQKVVSIMRYARSQAMYRQVPVVVFLDLKDDFWWLEGGGAGKKVFKKGASRFSKGVDLVEFRYGDGRLSGKIAHAKFYPTGSSSGGELLLKGREGKATVHIEPFTGLASFDSGGSGG